MSALLVLFSLATLGACMERARVLDLRRIEAYANGESS